MRRGVCWVMLAAFFAGLAGCQSPAPAGRAGSATAPQLDAGAANAAALSAQEADDARRLYVAKCARCHKFYHPADYSETEWRSWMARMGRKARLKPDQQELLSRYLEVFRTVEPGRVHPPGTGR